MNLTYFYPKMRGNVVKKTTAQSTSDCRQNIRHQKFLSKHQIWW